MNSQVFKNNLISSIEELLLMENRHFSDQSKLLFTITPIYEESKRYNSKDEFMQRTVFSQENIHGKIINLNDVVRVFSGLSPLFPLWIKLSFKESVNDSLLIELTTSLRFRKPSVVMNTGSKHPPFFIGNDTTPE